MDCSEGFSHSFYWKNGTKLSVLCKGVCVCKQSLCGQGMQCRHALLWSGLLAPTSCPAGVGRRQSSKKGNAFSMYM